MIHTSPPDTFEYLIEYDEIEKFYKAYYEVRHDKEKLQKMLNMAGDLRKYLLTEVFEEDLGELKVRTLFADRYKHDITIRKHTRYSPDLAHDHTFFEMIYVLKGKADNTIENKLYKMSDGDICLIPPNVFHKLWVGDDSVVINIIMKKSLFDDNFLNEISKGSMLIKFIKQNLYMHPLGEKKFLMFHALHNAPLRNLLAVLISESFKGRNSFPVKKALVIAIFNYLANLEDYDDEVSEKNEVVHSILEYIQRNHATVTLSEVARHFNYSEPYFSKYIKRLTGMSFVNILQTTRLKEACHLLATTNMRISDIPGKVGYDNVAYFNRVFKQKIGTTPYKYRKMHRNAMLNDMGGLNLQL